MGTKKKCDDHDHDKDKDCPDKRDKCCDRDHDDDHDDCKDHNRDDCEYREHYKYREYWKSRDCDDDKKDRDDWKCRDRDDKKNRDDHKNDRDDDRHDSSSHGIKELEKTIRALADALAGLGRGGHLQELLDIIHKPGWTTKAELAFVNAILDHISVDVRALDRLQADLVEASRKVAKKHD
jgi:hypothetical protein